MSTVLMLPRKAASSFSLRPAIGHTRPRSVISPVMASLTRPRLDSPRRVFQSRSADWLADDFVKNSGKRGSGASVCENASCRVVSRPRRAAGAHLLSYCNNASLRKAARRLGKLYDGVLEPSGLKATQCILLTQIYDLGSPTMAELANGLLMDLSATRHSLGPLIRDRLVRLRVDPKDRRVKRATLTPTGVAKFKEANQLWRKAQDRFERALSPARAAKLRSELRFLTSEEFKEAF